MPCNTAVAFQDEIASAVEIPVLSIVDETVAAAVAAVPGLTSVGILATDGTLKAETYHRAALAAGIAPVVPDDVVQKDVMSMIYDGVKAGMPVERSRFDAAVQHLRTKGAGAVMLACTEPVDPQDGPAGRAARRRRLARRARRPHRDHGRRTAALTMGRRTPARSVSSAVHLDLPR